jgi:hypothetical protein
MIETGLKAYSQPGMLKTILKYLTSVLFLVLCCAILTGFIKATPAHSTVIQQNPLDKQLLLNGRIWRNQYSKAFGDPFFLVNTFLKGSVTLNGQQFNNLDLKYDITNDELILSIETYPAIIMNKEMVDSFSLDFGNINYHIINAGTDTSGVLRGYVNVLYNGPSSLYVKYSKKLQPLAIDGRYDLFFQEHRTYLRKGNEIVVITGKRNLLNLLEDKKKEVRYYLRSSKFKIMRKDPGTYIPVLKYYDSIQN